MHTTNLRKVGGSVMMAVPPALLDLLHIGAGAKVGLAVDNGRLVVDPQPRPRYTLDELLAQCDGVKTGRQLFQQLKETGAIPSQASASEFAEAVRPLISGGFLELEGFRPPQAAE